MDADADLLRYFATPIVFVTDAVRIRRFDPRDQVFAHQIAAVVHTAESAQRAILQRDWPNFVPQGLTILAGARSISEEGPQLATTMTSARTWRRQQARFTSTFRTGPGLEASSEAVSMLALWLGRRCRFLSFAEGSGSMLLKGIDVPTTLLARADEVIE